MKRIFLLVLVLSMFAGAVYADEIADSIAKKEPDANAELSKDEMPTQQPTAEELAYRADTATILNLLGNIRDFHHGSSDDTEVQKNSKKRKLEKALVQFNSRCKGTRLTLQRAELEDVTAEKVYSGFMSSKETGKYTATYYIPLPEKVEDSTLYNGWIAIGQSKYNDDGTTAYEEFRQGLPAGKLDFKSFQYLKVKIVKTFPNENSVINLRKGSIAPLTGKIRGVYYYEILDSLTIWID